MRVCRLSSTLPRSVRIAMWGTAIYRGLFLLMIRAGRQMAPAADRTQVTPLMLESVASLSGFAGLMFWVIRRAHLNVVLTVGPEGGRRSLQNLEPALADCAAVSSRLSCGEGCAQ